MENPEIIYCDNHLFVVNKVAGLLVQRDSSGDPSLLELSKACIKREFKKPGNVYLGLVHRLDRPVSGIVIFARTSKSAARLSEQFRHRTVRKVYHALVEGKVPREGVWFDNIIRNGVTSRITQSKKGLPAELSFTRLNYNEGISFVQIELGTGRHHQIRVQFASRGYPILGDFRYGSRVKFGDKALALHARALTINHPVKKVAMTFLANYPPGWSGHLKI